MGLSTLSKSADNTNLSGVTKTLEGTDFIQRDLDRPEGWECTNSIKFNKAKGKVAHGSGQYQAQEQAEWRMDWEESLGNLVDAKLAEIWKCELTYQKTTSILGCIQSSIGSRLRRWFLPLYCTLMRERPSTCSAASSAATPNITIWMYWSKSRGIPEDAQRTGASLLWKMKWNNGLGWPFFFYLSGYWLYFNRFIFTLFVFRHILTPYTLSLDTEVVCQIQV